MRFQWSGFITILIASTILMCYSLPPAVATVTDEDIALPENRHAAWSPDGQHIAFDSDHMGDNTDIWLIHPDGTNLQRLTTNSSVDFRPQWKSDSQVIYFISGRGGKNQVWKMSSSGANPTQVNFQDSNIFSFSVSHNAVELALETTRGGDVDIILVSAQNGSELRYLAGSASNEVEPTWSPDDQQVAFAKGGGIWVRNAIDRSNLRKVTSFPVGTLVGAPDWSSNGFIAFTAGADIYKVRLDGSEQTLLFADAEGTAVDPAWSPDGTKLVFTRILDASNDLWIINADGTDLHRLTTLNQFQP